MVAEDPEAGVEAVQVGAAAEVVAVEVVAEAAAHPWCFLLHRFPPPVAPSQTPVSPRA